MDTGVCNKPSLVAKPTYFSPGSTEPVELGNMTGLVEGNPVKVVRGVGCEIKGVVETAPLGELDTQTLTEASTEDKTASSLVNRKENWSLKSTNSLLDG